MGGLSHTVSGDIASFRTPSKVQIESLKFHFLPKQEGSGDPSPSNVRPITGWTGLNGRRAGKNIININNPDIYYIGTQKVNNTFVNTVADTRTGVQLAIVGCKTVSTVINILKSSAIITSPSTVKLVATITPEFSEMTHLCVKHNGISRDFKVLFPLKIPVGSTICVTVNILSTDVGTIGGFKMNNIQIEVGDSTSSYESYSGSEIPITFPDGQTIYGGYVDLVAGEIWKTHYIAEINKVRQYVSDNQYFWYVTIGELNAIPSIKSENAGMFADRLKVVSGLGTGNPENQITFYANGIIRWKENGEMSLSEYEAYLEDNPITISYEMTTPVLVSTFSPQDLKTFLDYNNFWSDANDITEVTYAITESKDILATRKKAIDFDHAHHKKVKWNQLVPDFNSSGWDIYITAALSGTINNGLADITFVTDGSYSRYQASIYSGRIDWVEGHYYYASYMIKPTYNGKFGIEYARGRQISGMKTVNANEWGRASACSTARSTGRSSVYVPFPEPPGAINDGFQIKSPIVIDLTLMFGEGNEPTQTEFEKICAINYIDLTVYHPIDSGTEMYWIIP